jgi:hypothetical protein
MTRAYVYTPAVRPPLLRALLPAALSPAAKTDRYRFLPPAGLAGTPALTCFTLEYTRARRWPSLRNPVLPGR